MRMPGFFYSLALFTQEDRSKIILVVFSPSEDCPEKKATLNISGFFWVSRKMNDYVSKIGFKTHPDWYFTRAIEQFEISDFHPLQSGHLLQELT